MKLRGNASHARRQSTPLWVGILGVLLGLFWCGLFAAAPPVLNDSIEGQKLAREIRALVPTESARFAGVLRITMPGTGVREIPVQSAVLVFGTNWNSTYEAGGKGAPAEVLKIHHSLAQPNKYEWRRGDEVVKLDGGKATNNFAGSDFALLDLGLEFFNWPTQVVVTREMRKGRGCDVLESRPATPSLYSRVLSWIDQESRAQGQPGLLMAEGYDRNGKLLKEFEIKSFKKVAGRWEVSEMEIRNRQTKGSTRLQFDFSQ